MRPEKSPQVPLTQSQIEACEYEAILGKAKTPDCMNYWRPLLDEALAASKAGELERGAAIRILGLASLVHLNASDAKAPFANDVIIERELVPALNASLGTQWAGFAEFTRKCSDPELRARLADLQWVLRRDYKMVEVAVDAYLESATRLEDPEHWVAHSERWERALRLALSISNEALAAKATAAIVTVLRKHDGQDPLYMTTHLVEVLLDTRQADPVALLPVVDHAITHARDAKNWRKEGLLLVCQARLHERAGDAEAAKTARLAAAQTRVKKATLPPVTWSPRTSTNRAWKLCAGLEPNRRT